ncbi:hypothetical protein, partial [Butyricimonas faecihominis]|uniref:hypothetical protein n=1 Tax=Butyricimonas faecihominis TaxID=1472416 RepID=UPI0034A3EA8F
VEWRSASGSEPPRMATRAGGGNYSFCDFKESSAFIYRSSIFSVCSRALFSFSSILLCFCMASVRFVDASIDILNNSFSYSKESCKLRASS